MSAAILEHRHTVFPSARADLRATTTRVTVKEAPLRGYLRIQVLSRDIGLRTRELLAVTARGEKIVITYRSKPIAATLPWHVFMSANYEIRDPEGKISVQLKTRR